jgi:hypothetical protein
MSAATFEDHPTDPNKVILRKKSHLNKGRDYEEGFIDGMQHQMQSSVDKAVNAMAKREWVGLTDEEMYQLANQVGFDAELMQRNHDKGFPSIAELFAKVIDAKLKEKNT